MDTARNPASALVLATAASAAGLLLAPRPFGLITTIAGILLTLIAATSNSGREKSAWDGFLCSAVAGLSLMFALAVVLQRFTDIAPFETLVAIGWLAATCIVFAIDRSRVPSQPKLQGYGLSQAPAAPVEAAPHPSTFATAPPPVFPSPSIEEAPLMPDVPAGPLPEESEPVHPSSVETAPAVAGVEPPAATPQSAPLAQGITPPLTTIYVSLIGAGVAYLRPVQAEHLARDVYRINDIMPPDEFWKYEPGQVVRCKKQKLSNGKALVAYEEVILQRVN